MCKVYLKYICQFITMQNKFNSLHGRILGAVKFGRITLLLKGTLIHGHLYLTQLIRSSCTHISLAHGIMSLMRFCAHGKMLLARGVRIGLTTFCHAQGSALTTLCYMYAHGNFFIYFVCKGHQLYQSSSPPVQCPFWLMQVNSLAKHRHSVSYQVL